MTQNPYDTSALFQPLKFARGPESRNRVMLAPLTNTMSNPDGTLTDNEIRWLTMRAQGGFGVVVSAASHVQPNGQGFPGQLGIFGDQHLAGLERMAAGLRAAGAVSNVQLHHAGNRAYAEVADKVAPSANADAGTRELSDGEVEALIESFVQGAVRAEKAGFDGVQIHGAHGYIITSFLSPEQNTREDRWGGSFENRSRILFRVIEGIRAETASSFQLGVRISVERFGLLLAESIELTRRLLGGGAIDYLDLSVWDVCKEPEEEAYQGSSLLSHFTGLDRGETRLGAAGKIRSGQDAAAALAAGLDFITIGQAGLIYHDFPQRIERDPAFAVPNQSFSVEHLNAEGVVDSFIPYLRRTRPGVVAE